MNASQTHVLICMPVENNGLDEEFEPVRGAHIEQCSRCFCDVWQAPSSTEIENKYLIRRVCWRCMPHLLMEDAEKGEPSELMPLLEDQFAEIKAELRHRRERN